MAVASRRRRGGGAVWTLAEALARVPGLGALENRLFLIRMLCDEFGVQLSVSEHSVAKRHLFYIADTCQLQPAGLDVLYTVLVRMLDGAADLIDVRRILDEIATTPAWSPDDQRQLFDLFGGLAPSELADVYRLVGGATAPELPEYATCREAFQLLETLNAGVDGLPRSVVFVERIAAVFRADLAKELQDWADRQAARMDLVTELLAVRRQARQPLPLPPPRHAPAYLVFLLQREGAAGTTFRLSCWHQLDQSGGWHPERAPDVTGSLSEIKTDVAAIVETVEELWAEYQPDIRLEFVLSGELLNLDVDQWPWERDSPVAVPIGCRYSVVLRDLRRMRTKKWHRLWLRRWQLLANQLSRGGALAADAGYWSTSNDERGLREIVAAFEKEADLLALVLSEPPRLWSDGGGEIGMALRVGVPLILWDRNDCTSDGFVTTARGLLYGRSPGELLDRVKAARVNAFSLGTETHHAGSSLSLLWDDPNRQVVPGPEFSLEEAAS